MIAARRPKASAEQPKESLCRMFPGARPAKEMVAAARCPASEEFPLSAAEAQRRGSSQIDNGATSSATSSFDIAPRVRVREYFRHLRRNRPICRHVHLLEDSPHTNTV